MLDSDFQFVFGFQIGCNIESQRRPPHPTAVEGVAVDGHGGIGSDAFKVQEIAFPGFRRSGESLFIFGCTMQITVAQLPIAIVAVEVMRYRHVVP